MILSRAMRLLPLIALICVSWSNTAVAQQNDNSLVLRVSVTDPNAKPFTGLKPENFSVTVDNTPRKIISFSDESTPASVGLLIDASGSSGLDSARSSREFREKISEGIRHFWQVSHSENEYFAAVFDKQVAFTEGWIRASDGLELTNSGDFRGTALYDTLYYALQRVETGRHSRRVIVVLSDGHDNASKRTFKEVRDLIKSSDVTVFALCLFSKSELNAPVMEGQQVLEELTEASGGRTFFLIRNADSEVVNGMFDWVAREMQTQYYLTIEKQPASTPKKWRKLKLKIDKDETKRWPDLYVRSRNGYYQ